MTRYARSECMKIEVADKVATEARNAINHKLNRELRSIWDDLANNYAVSAVVLTGAGDGLEQGEVHDPMISRRGVSRQLELDKPIIAAINGDAIGLAATDALLCGITVMAEDARIGDTHVSRVGLVAGDGGTVIWPLLVGINKANEFLIRGTLRSGREAERIGSVNDLAPRSEVLAKARSIALELANGPTSAIHWTMLSINQVVKERVNLLLEASMALEQVTFDTADHKGATSSFKEKRKPKFGQS